MFYHEEILSTNNANEGWHRDFQTNVTGYHATFWKFLNILQGEGLSHLRNQGRHLLPSQKRRYLDCNLRIIRIVNDYLNRGRISYLEFIIQCIVYSGTNVHYELFHFFR